MKDIFVNSRNKSDFSSVYGAIAIGKLMEPYIELRLSTFVNMLSQKRTLHCAQSDL